jgi:hypothetical protein
MYRCPQNHDSETADFCSVCGVEIGSSPATVAPAPVAAPAAAGPREACPDCQTLRAGPAAAFCEVCGYNFQTGRSGVPPLTSARPAPPVAPASNQTSGRARWDLVITVDPALYGTTHPDAPVGQPVQTFTLFEAESLIGRAGADVRVHVPIHNDIGVSRRQAVLVNRPDTGLTVRDLGSANGTQLNGVELVPGVDTPVKDGDILAIGAWTRISVRAPRGQEEHENFRSRFTDASSDLADESA